MSKSSTLGQTSVFFYHIEISNNFHSAELDKNDVGLLWEVPASYFISESIDIT